MSELRILPADDMSREEWLAERKKGIGSSDIAAIIGADPYRTALDVWLDKTGRDAAGIESRPMRLGRKLEPIILAEFVEETGHEAVLDNRLAWHPTCPIACATPDALLLDLPAGAELKAPGYRQHGHWGRSWGNEYPEQYLAQCAWQMAVKDLPTWFLAALIGGQELRVYRIDRDRDLEEGLLAAAEQFRRDYIVTDRCPPLDASEAARRYVQSRFPESTAVVRAATPEETALVEQLAAARDQKAAAEAEEDRVGNLLRESIGEAEGIEIKGRAKVSWKSRRGNTKTDWEAVARTFSPADELITEHTTTGASTRVFRPTGPMFPSRRQRGQEE